MSSCYDLLDETEDRYLIDCPGDTIKEIFWLVDGSESDKPVPSILSQWEYYGFGPEEPEPIHLEAAQVAADLKALIAVFLKLNPDRRFGVLTALEWIDTFTDALNYISEHPKSTFRSKFFE